MWPQICWTEFLQWEVNDCVILPQFGRKKKKYRGKTNSTSSSKESEKKEVVKGHEEEEEEEEEEEDGDLSKYKLDVRLVAGVGILRQQIIY